MILYFILTCVFVYANTIDNIVHNINISEIKLKHLNYNEDTVNLKIDQLSNKIDEVNNKLAKAKEHLQSQQNKFINLISEAVFLNFSQNKDNYNTHKNSFITKVFFDEYIKQNINNMNYLKEDIGHIINNIKLLNSENSNLADELKINLNNKKEYSDFLIHLEKLNEQLNEEENLYANNLINLESQKHILIQQLKELNILNEDYVNCFLKYSKGIQKAIKLISNDNRYFRNKSKYKKSKQIKFLTSYKRRCRINSFKGEKTISPLENSTLEQPFGVNNDKYNLNIYNYFIKLSVNELDNKVYNILNGEIKFIGNIGDYENIMIIKHNNKLHSIYIGIEKLAPNIKVGSKVKKGRIIAKVEKYLIFQVIKGNRYMNPLELIKL